MATCTRKPATEGCTDQSGNVACATATHTASSGAPYATTSISNRASSSGDPYAIFSAATHADFIGAPYTTPSATIRPASNNATYAFNTACGPPIANTGPDPDPTSALA